MTLTHQHRGETLHLLVDSTGIKMLGEGEWKRKKHGADYRRQWRKVHLGIDAQTLEVRAIEVTANSVGDAPMLPALLEQTPPDEPIESVGADGAYETKACHAAIASRGTNALIPVRKNAKPWKEGRKWGCASPERNSPDHPPFGPGNLEEVEWLPPTQPGRNQDALFQVARRARDGSRL